jgi:uncharacterized membrane protein
MPIVRTCIKLLTKKGFVFVALAFLFGAAIFPAFTVRAQEAAVQADAAQVEEVPEFIPNEYVLGKVMSITDEGTEGWEGFEDAYQIALIKIETGDDAGDVVTLEYRSSSIGFAQIALREGEALILVKTTSAQGQISYSILDKFRLPVIFALAIFFALLAIVLGRWKGVMSLVGLGVSLAVLVGFVVPHIMAGESPVLISAIGSLMIAITSLFLAHGFTKRTLIAFSATILVLAFAFGLSYLTVLFAMLSGANSEEAVFLQVGYLQNLDLRGLLLGGLVIGALGVLDDVTTAQVAAVEEIHRANRALDVKELYSRGISVGREHIASLVNTLALAYVGASFPLFLLFSMPDTPPLWVLLNGESLAVEMLRALVGGSALMLAVPVATAFAAWACGKGWIKSSEHTSGGHHH